MPGFVRKIEGGIYIDWNCNRVQKLENGIFIPTVMGLKEEQVSFDKDLALLLERYFAPATDIG